VPQIGLSWGCRSGERYSLPSHTTAVVRPFSVGAPTPASRALGPRAWPREPGARSQRGP
jgi:hypothetical protein